MTGASGRLHCLDGLRGLLAFYVLVSHMAAFTVLPVWLTHPFAHGEAAVDLFFVLSGMVIVHSLETFDHDRGRFLFARAARTMPVFLVVFAVAVPVQPLPTPLAWMPWVAADEPGRVVWSSGWPINWAAEIGAHLSMTHGLFPAAALPDAWISFLGCAWSLSTEWQFYALIALLIPALSRLAPASARPSDRPAGALFSLARLLLVISVLALLWSRTGPVEWQFSKAFLPNKAQYFALGVASAGWAADARAGAALRFVGVLGVVVALAIIQGGAGKLAAPMIWTACLLAQRAADRGQATDMLGRLAAVLRAPPLLGLGAASYCIYLVNEPVQKLLGLALARACQGSGVLFTVLWVPSAILLPLTFAWILHVRIEQPALRAGRRIAARGLAPAA